MKLDVFRQISLITERTTYIHKIEVVEQGKKP